MSSSRERPAPIDGDEARRDLVHRLREILADEPVTAEKPMFGEVCMMVAGRILVCAGKGGRLLIRVSADRTEQELARPGASPAVMGAGRPMGAGWITVDASAIGSDEQLRDRLTPALEHNRAVTGTDRPAGPAHPPGRTV